jgi:hypothetical protein
MFLFSGYQLTERWFNLKQDKEEIPKSYSNSVFVFRSPILGIAIGNRWS